MIIVKFSEKTLKEKIMSEKNVYMAVIKFSENGLTAPKNLVQLTDVTDKLPDEFLDQIRQIKHTIIKNGDYVYVYSVYKSFISGCISAFGFCDLVDTPNFIPNLHTEN